MATNKANSYIPLIIERLKELEPAKVILFGSYAEGTASADSDLDLLVVTNHDALPKNYHEKEEIYRPELTNMVAFHAQQAVEKALKAVLDN